MPEKTPISVFLAPDLRVAGMIAEWLLKKGIVTEVRPSAPTAEVDPLTGATSMTDGAGVQVLVTDPARVDEAKQVIADRAAEAEAFRAKRAAREARTGTVAAACEECGKSSEWPAAEMGTTQTCPHCGG